jgi:hypothetical protein
VEQGHPVAGFERSKDMIAFHRGKATECKTRLALSMEWLQLGDRSPEYGVKRKNDCALDEVLQLTNVTRPAVSNKRVHGLARDPVDIPVHSPRIERKKMAGQLQNIFGPLSQRRNVNREDAQPVIKVSRKVD